MNRTVSTNLSAITPAALPPARREGRTRVLFITPSILGFATAAKQLEHYAALREDIDAVHINVVRPTWVKILGKSLPIPAGWNFQQHRYFLIYRHLLRRWLRGPLPLERFDVVHVMTPTFALAALDFAGGATKFGVQIDGTFTQSCREFGESARALRWVIGAERRIYTAADLVISASEWAARSAREDYGVGDAKSLVARMSIPLGAERKPDDSDRLPRLVFVGKEWGRKGGPLLLKVHQQHFADRAELHVISGAAPIDRAAKNVIWHGAVPREKLLDELLPTMDVFVMPTRMDQSPWAMLEAAGAGLPVISTPIGAIPEIVRDGETGLLTPHGDEAALTAAIDRLLSDRALRERMGSAARVHVSQHYNPDIEYGKLLDALAALAR